MNLFQEVIIMQTIPFHSLYVSCKDNENTDYLERKKMIEDHLAYSAGQVKKVNSNFYEVGVIQIDIPNNKYITFCIHNRKLHLAMYDVKKDEFTRHIDFSEFKKIKTEHLGKLDTRIQNTIAGTLQFRDEKIKQYWDNELKIIEKEEKANEKYHLSSFDDRIKDAINRVNHSKIDPNVQERREKILSRQSTNPGRD